MATLRSPAGCAWDREQTLKSLRPYLIEETYEVIDAIDRNDLSSLQNELGDFLLEAVFVAQICSEQNSFHIGDSIDAVCEKLIRRHPHVFQENAEDEESLTSAEVKQQWEIIKANERADQKHLTGLLSNLPSHLPSLLHADRIGRRASVVGFDWQSIDDVDKKSLRNLKNLIARERKETQRPSRKNSETFFSPSRTWLDILKLNPKLHYGQPIRNLRIDLPNSKTHSEIEE